MSMSWQHRTPQRPDRYLDWELQNRPHEAGAPERWCSVLLQLARGPAEDPARDLNRLLEAVATGSIGDGVGIKMHGDEEDHLSVTATALVNTPDNFSDDGDDAGLQFFAYMPEDGAYMQGEYAQGEFYKVRYAGPPIEGLTVNKERGSGKTDTPDPKFMGASVAVGVIDDGIAFAHERFRKPAEDIADGQNTRIAAIWLQDAERAKGDSGVAFGTRLVARKINELFGTASAATGAIDEDAVYRLAECRDFGRRSHNATAWRVAHGTHVMDLACGFSPVDAAEQAAAADFYVLAVQLPDAATADTSGMRMGSYVLQGLRQIMLWADHWDLPLAVNFSYGITAGPKDGTHDLEREIARLVDHRNKAGKPTAVIMPAGNNYRDRLAAKVTLAPGGREQLDWMILPDDATASYVEIWFDAAEAPTLSPIAVTLTPPEGPAGPLAMPQSGLGEVLGQDGRPVCGLYYDTPKTSPGRARIFLAVNPTKSWDAGVPLAPSGRWQISLENRGTAPIELRLYVQRDDTLSGFRAMGRQSFFDHPAGHEHDPATGNYDALGGEACPITHAETLSAIGCGPRTILVGAAQGGQHPGPADYTSSGPTPGRAGPDLSARADDSPVFTGILAAGSASGSVVALRGTSVAAPQVTRMLAERRLDISALLDVDPASHRDPRLGRFTLAPMKSLVSRRCEANAQDSDAPLPQTGGLPDEREAGNL